jgi:hypothetical protein
MNRSSHRAAIALGAALLVAACANTGTGVSSKQDMLVAAGFVPKNADTPSRIAALKSLPPHKFVTRAKNGSPRFLYADPTACGCIYVGDQQAYDQYRQLATRQTVSDDQVRAILSTAPLPGEEGL